MHTQNVVTGDNKCIKQVTRKCKWNTHRNQKEKIMQQKLIKKRPKRPCVFFGRMQYQLARHLRRHHKNEKAVSGLTKMKDDKDKNFVFSRIRKSENGRHGPKAREQKMHTQQIVTEDKKMHQTSDKEMYMEYTLLFGTTHIVESRIKIPDSL